MTFLETIKDILGLSPEGPSYSIEDLERTSTSYSNNVREAVRQLETLLTDKRWTLITKDPEGKVDPLGLLSKIKWRYLPNVESWVNDEFIVKIRAYSNPGASYAPSERVYCPKVNLLRDAALANGMSLYEASKENSDIISKILYFFTCDMRSPFEMKRSLYNGDCTPREISDWYIGGKHIVESNFRRIDNNLTKFIQFAKEKMR